MQYLLMQTFKEGLLEELINEVIFIFVIFDTIM